MSVHKRDPRTETHRGVPIEPVAILVRAVLPGWLTGGPDRQFDSKLLFGRADLFYSNGYAPARVGDPRSFGPFLWMASHQATSDMVRQIPGLWDRAMRDE